MDRTALTDGRWFDLDEATKVANEQTRWDGHIRVSLATGSQWEHEAVWRTKHGAYVLNRYGNNRDVWTALERKEAALWMLLHGDIAELPEDLAEFATLGEI